MASIVNYVADGSTNQFQIPFTYINQADVVVTVNGATPTFTFLNSTTINIAATPASGAKVIIKRVTPLNALVDFTDGSTLFEADLDLAHQQNRLIAEESRDRADSAIATINANIDDVNTVAGIAANVTTVAGNTNNVNSVATNMAEVLTADTNAATATTKAAEAVVSANTATAQATISTTKASESSASAAASLASKNAAATSETNASTSETNASNSATASANSASASSSSASGASGSATTATTKAAEALTSANNSATSATNSANSATTATTKASEASASQSAAATSETNALSSKNAAATSATNAATSETNAATSETNAATSASTATTKASEASTSSATATTKATESATSATASANSATASANSASTATTKASEASASAATALSHKNDAQTAKTASETAETNAETAETNAGASATAASNSASSASTSASTATTKATEASNSATTATTKASEAATSATNASTSASTATTKANEASTSATNAATSATSAQASKDAALAALDSFDDRYLGQKSADVTVDNDGDSLISGALYYNTTDDIMKVYDGSLWVAAYASLSGAMFGANNLSDVASTSGAVANLGLVIGTNVQAFSAILANTTASYTTAEESKLAGIEAGATADQTNAEIRAAVEAASDSNVFTDADHTKLNGIEASAKDDQTITAGSGLSGGGTGDVTLNHADTSSVSNSDNSGNTFIQDITFDTYGHVQSVGTGTVSVGNGTLTVQGTGALGGSGTFTANQSGNTTISISHDDTSNQSSSNNSGRTYIQDVTLDAYGHVTGLATATETVVNTDTTYSVGDGGLTQKNFTTTLKSKLDGIATSANNYSHPTGNGNNHIPSGGASGQILGYSSAGTAQWTTAGGGLPDPVNWGSPQHNFTSGSSWSVPSSIGDDDFVTFYLVGGGGGGGRDGANAGGGTGGAAVIFNIKKKHLPSSITYSIGSGGYEYTDGGNSEITISGRTYRARGGERGTSSQTRNQREGDFDNMISSGDMNLIGPAAAVVNGGAFYYTHDGYGYNYSYINRHTGVNQNNSVFGGASGGSRISSVTRNSGTSTYGGNGGANGGTGTGANGSVPGGGGGGSHNPGGSSSYGGSGSLRIYY